VETFRIGVVRILVYDIILQNVFNLCLQVFFDLMCKIAAQKYAENSAEEKEDMATEACYEIL
jgi:hypothetical protein